MMSLIPIGVMALALLLLALLIPLLWHWLGIRVVLAMVVKQDDGGTLNPRWLIRLQLGVTRETRTRP